MKTLSLLLLALASVALADPLFGDWDFCIDHIEFTNHPGPAYTIFGFAGPHHMTEDLVVIASNKKNAAKTEQVEFEQVTLGFRCSDALYGNEGPGSGHDWCGKQSEFWGDFVAPPYWEHGHADPARTLCCYSKNWKGNPEGYNYNGNSVGGNPYIWISSGEEGKEIRCPENAPRATWQVKENGPLIEFCRIGRGKGMEHTPTCIGLPPPLANSKISICNNSAGSDEINGNVYVKIGGDGTVIAPGGGEFKVNLLFTNQGEIGDHTHLVAAEDVLVQQSVTVFGEAYFLKSGPSTGGHKCEQMSYDSTINTDECPEDATCGGTRCGFGGDPAIYYQDCVEGTTVLTYLTDCNHHGKGPASYEDPCQGTLKHLDPSDYSAICPETCTETLPESEDETEDEDGESGSTPQRMTPAYLLRVHYDGVQLAREIAEAEAAPASVGVVAAEAEVADLPSGTYTTTTSTSVDASRPTLVISQ